LAPDLYLNAMNGGEVFFIAIDEIQGGGLLGFASRYQVEGTEFGISVYVRGSAARRGIGSALLRMAESDAMASGATSIHIEASLAGFKFYSANGYEEVGRGETRLMSGKPIGCVFMRKTLGSAP
jgi:ribosomal protein S18 acetylase RimI-like enzyme